MEASVKFDLAPLIAALRNLGDELTQTRAAEEDMLVAAQPIVDAAKGYAPRDPGGRPGFAADTIHAEPFPTREAGEIARVGVGPDESGWYLRFAEYGTSKQAAHPFLRPAVDTQADAFQSKLVERLTVRVRKAWHA